MLATSPARTLACLCVASVCWAFSFGVTALANAALIMSSIYVIGLIVPWFVPETAGKPLPE